MHLTTVLTIAHREGRFSVASESNADDVETAQQRLADLLAPGIVSHSRHI